MCLSVGVGSPDGLLVSLVVPDQVKPHSLSSTWTPQGCVLSPLLLLNMMNLFRLISSGLTKHNNLGIK